MKNAIRPLKNNRPAASSAAPFPGAWRGVLTLGLVLAATLGAGSSYAASGHTGDLAAAQARLQALQTAGVPADNYNLAKAQCWLNAANTAQSENDRSGFGQQALQEASQLLSALEADKNTAPRYGSAAAQSLRPELAAQLKTLQSQAGARCAAQNLACAEVQLARAAHGQAHMGPKSAAPYLAVAQCALDEAQKQVQACVPPPAPAAPAPAAPVVEKTALEMDALFRFDRAGLADILPAGRSKLEQMVQKLKTWQQVERIHISAYTDSLGSTAYNQSLSQARANTIKAYLQAQQVQAGEMVAVGKGEAEPVTQAGQCPSSLPAQKLIACLQPDRRIEIELSGRK